MTVPIILGIIFIHWVADFVMQTDAQARNKSSSWGYLLEHTLVYSVIWLAISFLFIAGGTPLDKHPDVRILLFAPITFVCHTVTDYYTSRVNKSLWESQKVHDFFVAVGFDQFLHYAQLFITFYYLTK